MEAGEDPWFQFRRCKRGMVTGFVMWFPVTILSSFASLFLLGTDLLAGACGGATVVYATWHMFRLSQLRCPRCGERFFDRGGAPFLQRCTHCGVRKYGDI